MAKKEQDPKKVGLGRVVAWNSRAISQGIGLMVLGYLSLYCTDTLGMPAALVGTLLLVSKLLDGVTDVMAGFIVDRTNTKWGRGRPYEWCIIGMWVCIWLMFTCPPSFSLVAKCIWIIFMYALVNSVFYTFLQASNTVYMCRAFRYQEQYVSLSSTGAILSMICVAAFNIAIPSLIDKFGVSPSGWSFLMACVAIPMGLIGIMRFLFIKETVDVDASKNKEDGTAEKVTLSDVKKVLVSNPYIWIVALTLFVSNLVINMGANAYYFKYIVHNLGLLGLVSGVQILAIPVMIFVPAILKRISISKLILIGCIISAIGYGLNFIAGDNMVLLSVAAVLFGLGCVPINMLINLMIIECADFNEWKGAQRMEGTLTSVTSFMTKIGASLGAGVLGILLSVSGYVGEADKIPDSAVSMIRNLYSTIPAVMWLIVAFSLLFYKLDKQMPQIREELAIRRQKTEGAAAKTE